jgi:hypothetical protein
VTFLHSNALASQWEQNSALSNNVYRYALRIYWTFGDFTPVWVPTNPMGETNDVRVSVIIIRQSVGTHMHTRLHTDSHGGVYAVIFFPLAETYVEYALGGHVRLLSPVLLSTFRC